VWASSGKKRRMDELEVGDWIMSADAEKAGYSQVRRVTRTY
jgi:hypothetical protein